MKNYFKSSSMKENKLENSALPSTSSYLRLNPRLLIPSIFSFNNVYYKAVIMRDATNNVSPSFVLLYVTIFLHPLPKRNTSFCTRSVQLIYSVI